ncbi:DUF4394 domain-containing protein [Mucilaginibacter terrae]|uniref:DUF4394 domain-containing protein n=1 Tax=Mucilaginibacter terrae TaxID=1955052 RepID=UPI00362E0F02
MKTFKTFIPVKATALCAVALLLITSSCKKDNDNINQGEQIVVAPNVNVYALQQDNKILAFNAQSGTIFNQATSITGMQTGENMLAIDYRPATGQLYGVSSGSRIYVINPLTAVARAIGSAPFTPAIDGTVIGIDFNPTVDRIRLVTSNGQNLRLNPETGTVAFTDAAINGASGAKISSVAYTENKAGAATTILYDIDAVTKKLYKQDPPNDGRLVEVGALGVDATEVTDFDISPDGKAALVPITVGGKQGMYVLDLTNGKAYKSLEFPVKVLSLAIQTDPVAYALSSDNELMIFNPANIAPIAKAITGLQTGETILGIDFRPLNGQIYALGSTSRIYTLNASSGLATSVGTLTTALSGVSFGFDFNPVADRIRIVSNTGQNLRVNPADGATTVDGSITPTANLALSATAYTNSFAGATATTMFAINASTGRLYSLTDPNSGVLANDIGSLGVTIDAANGFDISSRTGDAYAILTVGGTTRFYGINLTTGAAQASTGATFTKGVRGFTLGLGF